MKTKFAVKIGSATAEDISKMEEMYSVDVFDSAAYIQYPTASSALTGAERIERRFGLAGEVVQVKTQHENIVSVMTRPQRR